MNKSGSTKKVKTNGKNLEAKFDRGESVLDYFDMGHQIKRVNLDVPEWAIKALDEEASRRGIARQALMKNWLIDKLDEIKKNPRLER
jgi:predicted DNA binding CopG/RHH family protein